MGMEKAMHTQMNHLKELRDVTVRMDHERQLREEAESGASRWEETQGVLSKLTYGLNQTRNFASRQAQRISLLENHLANMIWTPSSLHDSFNDPCGPVDTGTLPRSATGGPDESNNGGLATARNPG